MGVEYLTIIATIVAALVGAISGYLGAYFQTKELRRSKKDEVAQALTELELERLQELGLQPKYNSIAHYVVLRELLERYGNEKGDVPIEKIRDEVQQAYVIACPLCRRVADKDLTTTDPDVTLSNPLP